MKKSRYVKVNLALVLVMLGLSIIDPACGDIINGNTWIETWSSSPQFDYSDPETMSIGFDEAGEGSWFTFGMALGVKEYQFSSDTNNNEVNFIFSTYFESMAIQELNYRPVQLVDLIVFVEKIGPSYYYDDQKIEMVVGDEPVYGYNMETCFETKQRSDATAAAFEAGFEVAVTAAVAFFTESMSVAEVAHTVFASAWGITVYEDAYDDAGWSSGDTQAHFGWSQSADIGPWSQNCPEVVSQSTSNGIRWSQKKNVNPVSPMGIKVYVKFQIGGPDSGCFDSTWYDSRDYQGGTMYLYIDHKDYPLPPGYQP
ncbi:MAG: hypothetical protein ACFFFH_18165 [Candidatus Thorarchaeota archaeon]